MSDEKKQIDFSHLGGKKVGHPIVDRSEKKPIDFSHLGGKRVGQALDTSVEKEANTD